MIQRFNGSRFFNLLNSAFHVKILLRHVIVFAVENFLEAADGFSDRHLFAG